MYTREYARAVRSMPEVARLASSSNLFNELKSTRKTINIDGETLYVLEGDVLLDETELELYALQQEALNQARALGVPVGRDNSRELLGILINGRIVRWPAGKVLSYAVLRQTFSDNRSCPPARLCRRRWFQMNAQPSSALGAGNVAPAGFK